MMMSVTISSSLEEEEESLLEFGSANDLAVDDLMFRSRGWPVTQKQTSQPQIPFIISLAGFKCHWTSETVFVLNI